MIIARSTRPNNPPSWRDVLPADDFQFCNPDDIGTAAWLAVGIASTIAADEMRLNDADIPNLDRLLLFAIVARLAADVDRLELSGGERAVLVTLTERVSERMERRDV